MDFEDTPEEAAFRTEVCTWLAEHAPAGGFGAHDTADLGDIVFSLVECGILIRQDEDCRDDFQDVFDFEEAFELDYPWEKRH